MPKDVCRRQKKRWKIHSIIDCLLSYVAYADCSHECVTHINADFSFFSGRKLACQCRGKLLIATALWVCITYPIIRYRLSLCVSDSLYECVYGLTHWLVTDHNVSQSKSILSFYSVAQFFWMRRTHTELFICLSAWKSAPVSPVTSVSCTAVVTQFTLLEQLRCAACWPQITQNVKDAPYRAKKPGRPCTATNHITWIAENIKQQFDLPSFMLYLTSSVTKKFPRSK